MRKEKRGNPLSPALLGTLFYKAVAGSKEKDSAKGRSRPDVICQKAALKVLQYAQKNNYTGVYF